MAEEGGKGGLPNLASFYIGVVDLFAILLPGAILAFILIPCVPWTELPQSELTSSPAVQWVAFSVAAYALGQLLFGLGGMVLDAVYNVFYKNGNKRLRIRRNQAYAELGRLVGFKSGTGDSALDWTLAILRLREPGAIVELDRLEADSKFMRSVTLTLAFSLPLIQYSRKGYAGTFGTFWLVGVAVLAGAVVERIFTRLQKWDSWLRWLTLIPAAVWFGGVILLLATHTDDRFFTNLGICSVALTIVTASRFSPAREFVGRMARPVHKWNRYLSCT